LSDSPIVVVCGRIRQSPQTGGWGDGTDARIIYPFAVTTRTIICNMDFLKTVSGKVISGVVVLAVIAAGISWWQMEPETRQMLVSGAGKITAWLLVVLAVPWATFFVIGRVAKMDSNLAGGVLVLSYTVIEALLLAWLFDWTLGSATAWGFFIAAFLLAGVYNVLTCDWIAEKVN
jgi:hypothetical protein